LVLPRLRLSAFGEPGETFGGRWSFDGIVTALRRENGPDTRKLGTEVGWERREILPMGLVGTLRGGVRDDIFWVNNLPDPTIPGRVFDDDTTNRLFPQAQALLSYPLVQDYGSFSHIVEPIAAISFAPTRDLDPRIPNEDSQDLEFDTTNLFEMNRYPGSDKMEQGTRATYGLRTGFYGHEGGMAEFIFGQNARITPDPQFPAGSGLETGLSDYVGQARLEPGDWMSLNYAFRLDRDAENFRKHDVNVSAGIPEFRPFASYLNFVPPVTAVTGVGRVDEITFGFSSHFMDYWTFTASRTNDLREGFEGPRNTHFDIAYADECFRTSFSFTRDETQRTGVNSGDIYFFTIYFKHLGGIDR
jgi:LPS-assembly protein